MAPNLNSTLFQQRPVAKKMNFSGKEVHGKDLSLFFLAYGEAGKRVVAFQADFCQVYEVLS